MMIIKILEPIPICVFVRRVDFLTSSNKSMTPPGYLTIQLNSYTEYTEIASDSTG